MTTTSLTPTPALDITFLTGRTLLTAEPTVSTSWNGDVDVALEYRADLLAAQTVAAHCLHLTCLRARIGIDSTHLTVENPALEIGELSRRLLLVEYAGLFYIRSSQTVMTTTHDLPIENNQQLIKSDAQRLLLFNLDHNPGAIEHAVRCLVATNELTATDLEHVRSRLREMGR